MGNPSEDQPRQQLADLFPPVTPWPEPIDPEALLGDLRSFFDRHVAMHPEQVTAVALWVLHAWTHDAVEVSPILAVVSPEKRCGKTTLLNCLTMLVPRALPTANVTPAAIFRVIEQSGPTLLIDEADTFLDDNQELRGVLNSGHTRMSARLIRCVGNDHKVQVFKTWAPKAIATIGRLPETLMDRSIVVRLQRRLAAEGIERLSDHPKADLDRLRQQCARFQEQVSSELTTYQPNVPAHINDRAHDNWRPLLQVAIACSSENVALNALAYIEGDAVQSDREALGTQVLADLRALFALQNEDSLSTTTILRHLHGLDERSWSEYRAGRPLTAAQLARLLKPYGVRPRQTKRNHKNLRGYRRDDLDESFDRYLSPLETTATPLLSASEHAAWVAAYDGVALPDRLDATAEATAAKQGSEVAPRAQETPS